MTDLTHRDAIQSQEVEDSTTGSIPLHHAIYTGNTDEINRLLTVQPNLVHARSKQERTPLHAAAYTGNHNLIRQLIEKGAKLDAKDIYGKTPLYLATEMGHLDIVSNLVDKGANVRIRDKNEKRSLLHVAAELDYDEIIKYLLIQRVHIDDQDAQGVTPCHLAAQHRNFNIVEYLIKNGNADTCLQDKEKETVLMVVVLRGNLELLNIILASRKALNKKFTSHEEKTLLHLGIQSEQEAILQALISLKIPLNTQEPDEYTDGPTPLHYAASRGYPNLVTLLLEAGADMNVPDRKGRTPLDYVMANNSIKIIELLKNYEFSRDLDACTQYFRGCF